MHLNGVDVTVVTADVNAKPANEYIRPKSGNRYVTVQVLYEDTGTDQYNYSSYDWKLVDEAGFSYDTTYGGIGPELRTGSLSAGERARGYVTYEVPTSATGLTLKLKSGDDNATVPLG